MKKIQSSLLIRLLIGIAFLLALVMWFFVQYNFAGPNFYMFSVKGAYLAFGYIEGYQGFLPFGLPPFLAVGAVAGLAITMLIKPAKIKVCLYTFCAAFALSSAAIYLTAFFNILHRFGDVRWSGWFWGAFALHFAALILSAYAVFISLRTRQPQANKAEEVS